MSDHGQEREVLDDDEREGLIAALRPPRRALTKREESAFLAARLAVFEQRDVHEAEGHELPLYDEQRIFFRAGLAALAAREEPPGEPDAALFWRAARAMWEAGPTTSRRGWEDLTERQREFAYNEARAAVGVVLAAAREDTEQPESRSRLRMLASTTGTCPICSQGMVREDTERPDARELEDLRACGDRLQSESSRIAEWMRTSDVQVSYEVGQSMLEVESAVRRWTEIRRKTVVRDTEQEPEL